MQSTASDLIGLTHVRFNEIYVPAQQAIDLCRRTAVPLYVQTGDDSWPIVSRGTAFLYRIGGRQMCIFTKHQMGEAEPNQVCFLLGKEPKFCTGLRCNEFDSGWEREENDLCVLELGVSLPNDLDDGPLFFKSKPIPKRVSNEDEKFFALGYPHRLIEVYGDWESAGFGMTQLLVWADKSIGPQNKSLATLELARGDVVGPRCHGDLSGFSGGPVFGLNRATQQIEFRGIAVTGGNMMLRFAISPWVDVLCNQIVRQTPAQLLLPLSDL